MISHEYMKVRRCKRRINKSYRSRYGTTITAALSRVSDYKNLAILKDNYKYHFLHSI